MTAVVQYRLSLKKNIGRTSEKSVVASAAYIARERLTDRESSKIYDYRKGHSEVLFSKIFTPEIVPEWVHNRNELWNKVQETEYRKDAQFARSLEISLPYEFTKEHMVELIEDFVRDNFVSQGMIADVALHKPDEHAASDRNYHAHILLTLREIGANGFGYKVRAWNHLNMLRRWREDLAFKLSKMFERPEYVQANNWLPERWLHSHLTLLQQRKKAIEREDFEYAEACNHEPTKHKGIPYHLEKRGVESYVDKNRLTRRNLSKIQQIQNIELQPSISEQHRQMENFHKRIDTFAENRNSEREQKKAERAIDDELRLKFGHFDPDLKSGKELTPEKRAKLLKALEYSKQAEKDFEHEHERER